MANLFTRIGAETVAESSAKKRGDTLVREFLAQLDAYYASPASSFYDDAISRRYYEQKLRYLRYIPYPDDGLITFGASGTNMCDRQLSFKNANIRVEKSDDLPFRGRQRRSGTAIVDYLQLDIVHMPKRLSKAAKFRMAEHSIPSDDPDEPATYYTEWYFEESAQTRRVFTHPHPETGELVTFAITAKPDGILDYTPDGRRILFEYKTKASGLRAMNGKLDYKGAQDDHKRQVTAESLVFGLDDVIIAYESTQKPAWFDDADNSGVTKGQKTWENGKPRPDIRAFYVEVTEDMRNALLSDLARQAALVYESKRTGCVPAVTVDMTQSCGFCAYGAHCRATLTEGNRALLERVEAQMAASHMAGKAEHRNLRNYLSEGRSLVVTKDSAQKFRKGDEE